MTCQLQRRTCRGVHGEGPRRADPALHPRRLAARAVRQEQLHLPAAVRGALGVPAVPARRLGSLQCIPVIASKPSFGL